MATTSPAMTRETNPLIPAKAGIQKMLRWVPAFAGTSGGSVLRIFAGESDPMDRKARRHEFLNLIRKQINARVSVACTRHSSCAGNSC